MADLGIIEAEINSLPQELRAPMLRIFRSFLPDIRFGHPKGEQPDPMKNLGGGFFQATTPAIANTEFTIDVSRFGRTPYLLIPVLPLDEINAQIVPLKVTRAADNQRVYVSSSVTGAAITVAIEG